MPVLLEAAVEVVVNCRILAEHLIEVRLALEASGLGRRVRHEIRPVHLIH